MKLIWTDFSRGHEAHASKDVHVQASDVVTTQKVWNTVKTNGFYCFSCLECHEKLVQRLKKLPNGELKTERVYMNDLKSDFQCPKRGFKASWKRRSGLWRRLGDVTKKQKDVRRCDYDAG